MPEKRLLSTIMFYDIEGYTRMMEKDEKTGRSMAQRYQVGLDLDLDFGHGL